jgi:MarR family transcriptional regulator, temperature-dependent positive regulator of motility
MADLARALRDALRAVEGDILATLQAHGYSGLRPGHWLVFRHLDPEGMTLSALARDAGVTRQSVSQVVTELEQLGLVEVVPDLADRRAKVVRYTRRGRRGFEVATQAFRDIERRYARAIGRRELADAVSVLERIAGD